MERTIDFVEFRTEPGSIYKRQSIRKYDIIEQEHSFFKKKFHTPLPGELGFPHQSEQIQADHDDDDGFEFDSNNLNNDELFEMIKHRPTMSPLKLPQEKSSVSSQSSLIPRND